ncbi:MAG: hypothetical protein JW908_10615 [Anaerolineales bacterium]|nr:hypothetical protein [Anaerolineales bacterium]
MTYLTLFTAPKPFSDPHISIIQRNALSSWMRLGEGTEIILVGDEPGMAEVAKEFGLKQLTNVARNEEGTPLVNSIFNVTRQSTNSPLMAYINTDMLIFSDFVDTAKRVVEQAKDFLIIGQRWDLQVNTLLDFFPGWEKQLREEVKLNGRQHRPAGSDYFIFPRHIFQEIPEFAIGRAGWDNWMIYHARHQGWRVVDATPSLMVIHQEHGYSHLPGGQPHFNLEESQRNMALAGGSHTMYTVLDSDWQLIDGELRRPRPSLLRILRRAENWFTPKTGERQGFWWALARRFRRFRRRMDKGHGAARR